MITNEFSQESPKPRRTRKPRPPIRWWPAVVIVIAAATATLWVWLVHDTWGQQRVLLTAQIVAGGLLLLLVWVMAFSRMARRLRMGILGGFVSLLLLAGLLLNIRGVTGDLLPILEWRWKSAEPPAAATSDLRADSTATPGELGETSNDYPQFLGPHRDGTVTGIRLDPDWVQSPPELLWRRPMGPGWSAFSISGHLAVTQEQQADRELVTAYNVRSGDRLWSHSDTARYSTTIAGEGPRATPTIDGPRVYTLGATGILNCLQLDTGERLWSRNILQENDASLLEWGIAGSPLVLGNLVIVSAGGSDGRSLVAYDKDSGAVAWSGGDDPAGYSSPSFAHLDGHDQILIFNGPGLAGHDAVDGRVLWDFPWAPRHPHVAMPVIVPGNRVLISSGYGSGSALLEINQQPGDSWDVRELWRSIRLKAKFANPTRLGDFVYGLDDGIMVCLDLTDGSQRWKDGRYGHGQQILVDTLLVVVTERGEIVVIEPVPEGLRELGRFQALNGKTWNPPALAGDLLLVRNDQEAACYRLPLLAAGPSHASSQRD
jgi:outer membrane protein assembly factor BamB